MSSTWHLQLPPTGSRRLWVPLGSLGVVLLTAQALLGILPATATAAGAAAAEGPSVSTYSATATLEDDGTLRVAETVTYDVTGGSVDTVSRVLDTRVHHDAENDRVYKIDGIEVAAVQGGVSFEATETREDLTINVRFDEPQNEPVTVTYEYDVEGAVAETADGLELRWPVVQGFGGTVEQATITWDAPGVLWLSCLSGAPGSSRPCTATQTAEVAAPTMEQVRLEQGGQVVGILGLSADSGVRPNADFQARWSLSRAFTATGSPLWLALGVLAMGALAAFLLWWTRGRDVEHDGSRVAMPVAPGPDGALVFAPPGAVRPGQMGTVADERADVVDVSATVVDLAVRNYLFIEELPHGEYGRTDWLLRRRNPPGDELLPYEREVFEAIFAGGDAVQVSELGVLLRSRLTRVQGLLYDDMVAQGWFGERPDAVRTRWTTAGWVLIATGVLLTFVLAFATRFGLVGLAVVLAGVALSIAGQLAPARTSKGSGLLQQLGQFREYLTAADVSEIPVDERERMIARLYPYAMVFGFGDRWAAALAATDMDESPDEPLHWYGAPDNWHLSDIAPSLAHLTAALNNAIGTRRLLID